MRGLDEIPSQIGDDEDASRERDQSPVRRPGLANSSIYEAEEGEEGLTGPYDPSDPYNLAREARMAELRPWTLPITLHVADSYLNPEGDVLRKGYKFNPAQFAEGAYHEVLVH